MAISEQTRERFIAQAKFHLGVGPAFFFSIPGLVWVLPVVLVPLTILIMQTPIGWMTEKPVQEIVAPTILGLSALLSITVHVWLRQTFSLILAFFVCSLFLREWHFEGTDPGIYYVLLALVFWASTKREAIAVFTSHRLVRAFFGAALWIYLIADLLDRHFFFYLPAYDTWQMSAEETLETFGHLMIFALVASTLRIGSVMESN